MSDLNDTSSIHPSGQPLHVTWSLMHPTPLDSGYFHEVMQWSKNYPVDSFELCGDCHGSNGGLDGCLDYDAFPAVAAGRDRNRIKANIDCLNRIVDMSHQAGKPVYIWHREIVLPEGLLQAMPGLSDEQGGFDFFGTALPRLLRYKVNSFLEVCPDIDGLVLTLTEADFGVIHPADPKRYPPDRVVAEIITLFLAVLAPHGKKFILRSFGSIPEDYEAILAGAELASAAAGSFEIETKITPYDFVPFLKSNPYLRPVNDCSSGVEIDVLGEFLGAGYLPAFNVCNLTEYVHKARRTGARRLALRLDRVGCRIFSRGYRGNLEAVYAALREPDRDSTGIAGEIAAAQCPRRPELFNRLMERGYEAITKTLYIDGNVMFHTTPLRPDLKWIHAGGLFGVLKGGVDLAGLNGIWSILSDRRGPERSAIRGEKEQACELAREGQKILESAREYLPPELISPLEEEFKTLVHASEWIRDFVFYCLDCLTFLEQSADGSDILKQQIEKLESRLTGGPAKGEDQASSSGPEEADGLFRKKRLQGGARAVWGESLLAIMKELLGRFQWELNLRKRLSREPGMIDYVVAGGLADDWRINRYMHGSHVAMGANGPVREIGNPVFPNGFAEITLFTPDRDQVKVRLDSVRPSQLRGCLTHAQGQEWLDPMPKLITVPGSGRLKIQSELLPDGRPAICWLALYQI